MSQPSQASIPLADLESSKAASFENIGDKYVGVITSIKHQQQTDPATGQVKTFQSGDPMWLYVITIEPTDGSDAVALWAKGGKFTAVQGSGDSMLSAIGKAVREAGASEVTVGGTLAVALTGMGEQKIGQSAPKCYTAQYRPPAPAAQTVPVDDLFSN